MEATTEINAVKAEENNPNVPKTSWLIYILTFLGQLSLISVGYDLGASSGAILLAQDIDYLHLTLVWKQLITAGAMPSATISCLIGAYLSDRFGRKKDLMFASFCIMLGSVVSSLAPNRVLLLIGRLLIGAGIGLAAAANGVYIAECSPSRIRGRLVSISQPLLTVGAIIGTVVSALFSYDKTNGWRYIWGIEGVFGCIQCLGLIFLPESPRWFIQKSLKEEAKKSLARIRNTKNVDEEIQEIEASYKEVQESIEKSGGGNILLRMFKTRSVRRALIVGCGLQIINQFSGGNTSMYYTGIIIHMSGVGSVTSALWNSVIVNCVSLVFASIGVWLVDTVGRRKLAIISLLGVCLSNLFLGTTFLMAARYSPSVNATDDFLNSNCYTYSQCADCIRDEACGFCYEDTSEVMNGVCLPVNNTIHLISEVGACNSSFALSTYSMKWAYDFCPVYFSWIAMIAIGLFFMFYQPGIGPLSWTLNAEIYPLWARSTGNGIASMTSNLCLFIAASTFLSFVELLHNYGVFYVMSSIALIGSIFCFFFLPETKNKSLEEIESLFSAKKAIS